MTSSSLNNLWNYIQGLSLTARNQEWLAARLKESAAKKNKSKMTKEEFFAGIDEARAQIDRGEGTTFTNKEDMNEWLNSL